MNSEIKTIPSSLQRYSTCGDYFLEPQNTCAKCRVVRYGDGPESVPKCPYCHEPMIRTEAIQFRINEMGNEDYEFLVAEHERIEEHLTRRRGLKEPDIMAFDLMWEKEREAGAHDPSEEPGHDPRAPYHREHVLAENIERMLAHAMGISWPVYENAVFDSCQ